MHWTGHKSRLDRDLKAVTGDKAKMTGIYAFEELVAEIGAMLLCLEFEVPPMFTHALYAASYVKYLEDWEGAVVDAAGKADAAVRWLLTKGGRLAADPKPAEADAVSRAA